MNHATRRRVGASLVLSCLVLPAAALAGPADYVDSPAVEEGEREIDFKAGTEKNREPHSEQPHKVGPALFGQFRLGGRQVIKYNDDAVLAGLTDAAPRHTLRLQAEYEF